MLKLVRRPVAEFLGAEHQQGLQARVDAARALAVDAGRPSADKSKAIGSRWDDFRKGKSAKGTFAALWCELRAMSFDKCALCETPGPGTVEHVEEKSVSPDKAFDWPNLLPTCDTCNRNRENSGIKTRPLDPSAVEPLDRLGWDEFGEFTAALAHHALVEDLVRMYGLHRFREARAERLHALRALLSTLVLDDAGRPETVKALRALLTATSAYLGPIREYLLRPPSDDDADLVQGALALMPEIRSLVAPWLRPPPWAPPWWR